MKRYTLTYVPMYDVPYVVSYKINKDGSKEFKQIKTTNGYDEVTKIKNAKYHLCDIDRLTNSYDSLYTFIRTQKVYMGVYKCFIAYKTGEHQKEIQPVFGSEYIKELLDSGKVVDDTVTDRSRIIHMADMFINDKKFLNKFLRGRYASPLRFTNTLEYLKFCLKELEHDDSGEVHREIYYAKGQIRSLLSRYNVYREALRCLEDYDNEKKQEQEEAPKVEVKEEPKPKIKKKGNMENQIFLPGFKNDEE